MSSQFNIISDMQRENEANFDCIKCNDSFSAAKNYKGAILCPKCNEAINEAIAINKFKDNHPDYEIIIPHWKLLGLLEDAFYEGWTKVHIDYPKAEFLEFLNSINLNPKP